MGGRHQGKSSECDRASDMNQPTFMTLDEALASLQSRRKAEAEALLRRWLAYFDKNGSSAGLKEDTEKFLNDL